jgi:hypothetical protein
MTKMGNFKNNVGTCCNLFFVAQQSKSGLDRPVVVVPRSHPPGRIPLNERSFRCRGRPARRTTNTREEHPCPERDAIPAIKLFQTFALDGTASGIGLCYNSLCKSRDSSSKWTAIIALFNLLHSLSIIITSSWLLLPYLADAVGYPTDLCIPFPVAYFCLSFRQNHIQRRDPVFFRR